MEPGATWTAAWPRKNVVPSTDAASRSRSSCAISSRPVASGTGGLPAAGDADGVAADRVRLEELLVELLRALAAVARAPALIGLGHDHRAQLEDGVYERLRARRAARHVQVDWHELVRRHDRVVVEDALRGRAGPHRDGPLRLEHLVVDAADDRGHL